mmetsp:Transcript_116570/g.341148  ORF Transcript_116570/g.341148 Transcript_116570/m.341148 type:complete len:212 (+) Transcript_116570:1351-1986(+)
MRKNSGQTRTRLPRPRPWRPQPAATGRRCRTPTAKSDPCQARRKLKRTAPRGSGIRTTRRSTTSRAWSLRAAAATRESRCGSSGRRSAKLSRPPTKTQMGLRSHGRHRRRRRPRRCRRGYRRLSRHNRGGLRQRALTLHLLGGRGCSTVWTGLRLRQGSGTPRRRGAASRCWSWRLPSRPGPRPPAPPSATPCRRLWLSWTSETCKGYAVR